MLRGRFLFSFGHLGHAADLAALAGCGRLQRQLFEVRLPVLRGALNVPAGSVEKTLFECLAARCGSGRAVECFGPGSVSIPLCPEAHGCWCICNRHEAQRVSSRRQRRALQAAVPLAQRLSAQFTSRKVKTHLVRNGVPEVHAVGVSGLVKPLRSGVADIGADAAAPHSTT